MALSKFLKAIAGITILSSLVGVSAFSTDNRSVSDFLRRL